MKKLITMIMLTFITLSANATLLSVDLNNAANTDYQIGDVLSADIVISNIEQDVFGFTKLVASFNTNFLFDDSFLAFNTVTFGTKLDVDPDPFFASDQFIDSSVAGELYIDEFAYAGFSDLLFAQGGLGQFVLATINFNVLQSGTSSLNFANVAIGDDIGYDFTNVQTMGSNFTVANSASVPEPSTFVLFLAAMMILLRRRAV